MDTEECTHDFGVVTHDFKEAIVRERSRGGTTHAKIIFFCRKCLVIETRSHCLNPNYESDIQARSDEAWEVRERLGM